MRKFKFKFNKHHIKNWILGILGFGILLTGILIMWASTLQLPDFRLFTERKVASSTKIYDRTGEIVLFDVHRNIKRTIIPYEEMGENTKKATIAIEDSEFYNHSGVRLKSLIRAVWSNISGGKVQGGSTITQQLIKGTLLTSERTVTRKIKEWILAIKLERVLSKDEILALYLNEAPYGGNIYGIQEASKAFFGKAPIDLTIAESAYMAAIPNGPTFYSPYTERSKARLDDRKNLVLKRMYDLKVINEEEYNSAREEKVAFLPSQPMYIAAPHFVFFVREYLERKYGTEAIENGGLKVVTTIDFELQKKTEEIVKARALENEKTWNGKNAAAVIIDPKTGDILAMVGSRNYFDKTIDGNFNVTTARRQPGSSFKPIVYATAFKEGYEKETVLFDVFTEFSSSCDPYGNPLGRNKRSDCYSPSNFDDSFRGPMSIKDALAQSINTIAVKVLYLVGMSDVIKTAQDLGITTLDDPKRYGLSLAIGGGETTLLEMTNAYSVFASEGVYRPYNSILYIENNKGEKLEEFKDNPQNRLDANVTRMISSILSDNQARTPTYGANSALKLPNNIESAVKTGTTNENRDAWTVGYTPSIVTGVWVGNNDNTPMKKGGVSLAGPIWQEIMMSALKDLPKDETFNKPEPVNKEKPPIIRGFWQGGETFKIDKKSGGLATEYTPPENIEEKSVTNVRTILYWINKDRPLEPKNPGPSNDSLYNNFETGVRDWWAKNSHKYRNIDRSDIPQYYDNINNAQSIPRVEVFNLKSNIYQEGEMLDINIQRISQVPFKKIDVFVNNKYHTSLRNPPYNISFDPYSLKTGNQNTIMISIYDDEGRLKQETFNFYTN